MHPAAGASTKPIISEHDDRLLARAQAMRPMYDEWAAVANMADDAESEEVRSWIRGIAASMYHTEEYMAGCL